MNIRAILAALLVITAALPAGGAAAAAAPDTDASTPTIQFQTDDGANETTPTTRRPAAVRTRLRG